MESNEEMYARVSREFAAKIHSIFDSEESMQARWEKWSGTRELDRTADWNFLLKRDLEEVWHEHGPVVKIPLMQADIDLILGNLSGLLDYNLFTQVYLNFQSLAPLKYSLDATRKLSAEIDSRWECKSHPNGVKKAHKAPATPEEQQFNADFNSLKAIKWVQEHCGYLNASFRVSPKGSTPALSDSLNLSNLTIFSDRFIEPKEGWSLFHVTWNQSPAMIKPGAAPGTFTTESIPYVFTSSSGGTMLNDVLFSRRMMFEVLTYLCMGYWLEYSVVIPRLTSLLILTRLEPKEFKAALTSLIDSKGQEAGLRIHEGIRNFSE